MKYKWSLDDAILAYEKRVTEGLKEMGVKFFEPWHSFQKLNLFGGEYWYRGCDPYMVGIHSTIIKSSYLETVTLSLENRILRNFGKLQTILETNLRMKQNFWRWLVMSKSLSELINITKGDLEILKTEKVVWRLFKLDINEETDYEYHVVVLTITTKEAEDSERYLEALKTIYRFTDECEKVV